MTSYPFQFDQDAAIAAMLYIAERVQGVTKHKMSKILYFADKAHLERYGRFITGDQYVAMEHGPVPSTVLGLIDQVDDRKNQQQGLFGSPMADLIQVQYTDNRPVIRPKAKADLDALSDSDLMCLDEAIAEYGPVVNFKHLSDLSHDAAWNATERNQRMRIEAIASTFEDPDLVLEHLKDPTP
ncbi:Panacea domain-containing protein [Deinococcus daejeonensis]|uniref:Antitoxin SocA-like Panacea domain-containing protein n=1 Tax=Deinococcus daejeonensis TaxID=1007098 RepID=A0ABQ2JCS5_9DEIO|nr:Panacea domain-containing protein [Deinococcus daejeonensis]GGN44278.1 hypothetical protein GCM10010842_32660 [Deinococcus daejeonensis]